MSIEVHVPGSKSITQRALITSALANGTSILKNPLISEDPLLLKDALCALGCKIDDNKDRTRSWNVYGTGGRLTPVSSPISIFMGNNGTGFRFITAVSCLARHSGSIRLYGTKRMEERPILPLIEALRTLGASVETEKCNDCPPVIVYPSQIRGGACMVDASRSSQYLSALLLIAPYANVPTEIRIKGGELASSPYLNITLSVMKDFGVDVKRDGNTFYPPLTPYKGREFFIEGDASSASYFFAAAAITGLEVTVKNIPQDSIQGDARFVMLLERMGCKVISHPASSLKGTTVKGPSPTSNGLCPIDVSMKDMPDMVPTLAAIAPFAQGKTIIRDCAHLRIKETDRVKAIATGLSRLGVEVEELSDGLIINGKGSDIDLAPAPIETYDDHRIAMSFAILQLRQKGIKINNPECVSKSFPDFWKLWRMAFNSIEL